MNIFISKMSLLVQSIYFVGAAASERIINLQRYPRYSFFHKRGMSKVPRVDDATALCTRSYNHDALFTNIVTAAAVAFITHCR